MKNRNNLITGLLLTAGIIEIVAGLGHFPMPHFAFQTQGFSSLDQNEANFIIAAVFATGVLLIALGIFTTYLSLSKDTPIKILLYFTTIQSVLWLGRIIIEIVYPVNISLFLIREPTRFLLPIFILEWLLFIIATFLLPKYQPSNLLHKGDSK